jgi:hypothetical protein
VNLNLVDLARLHFLDTAEPELVSYHTINDNPSTFWVIFFGSTIN